jgi:catechol 2,3-dioxygenase-like lactoylglutathione lyase family enzyme
VLNAKLHHYAVRAGTEQLAVTRDFYADVLGLVVDPARPPAAAVPGCWLTCADGTQIHVSAVDGVSPYASDPNDDPTLPHVAFGVDDIEAASAQLRASGVKFYAQDGPGTTAQLFLRDPTGTLIELHQADSCSCGR